MTPLELVVLVILGAIGGLLHWVIPYKNETVTVVSLVRRAVAGCIIAPICYKLLIPAIVSLMGADADLILAGYFGAILIGYFGLDILIVILDRVTVKKAPAKKQPQKKPANENKSLENKGNVFEKLVEESTKK